MSQRKGRPALLGIERNRDGDVVFVRTPAGQAVYDILMSHMSAREAARRHKLSRAVVLEMRRQYPDMRVKRKRRSKAR